MESERQLARGRDSESDRNGGHESKNDERILYTKKMGQERVAGGWDEV